MKTFYTKKLVCFKIILNNLSIVYEVLYLKLHLHLGLYLATTKATTVPLPIRGIDHPSAVNDEKERKFFDRDLLKMSYIFNKSR